MGIESNFFKLNPDPIEHPELIKTLILFYSKLDDENYLEDYLFDKDGNKICSIDLNFAYSTCKRFNRKRVEALILNYNQFYQESVEIALEIDDFQLAKLCALKSDQKELLLIKIAQYSKDFMMNLIFNLPLDFILFQDVPNKYILLKSIKNEKKEILKVNETEKKSLERLIQSNELNKMDFNDIEVKCQHKLCEKQKIILPIEMNKLLVFPCSHVLHVNCILSIIQMNSTGEKQMILKDSIEKLELLKGAKMNMIHEQLKSIASKECPLCSFYLNQKLPISQELKMKINRKKTTDEMIGIVELTPDIFDSFIKDQNAIVQFYHPQSSFCKQFIPHLVQTGKVLLTREIIKIGKMNCMVYPNFITRYKIDQFPFIILFKKNHPLIYQKNLKIHDFFETAQNLYSQ